MVGIEPNTIPEGRGLNFRGAFLADLRYYEDGFVEEAREHEILDRVDYLLEPPQRRKQLEGVARLKKFEYLLENGFAMKRSIFQKQFHDKIVQAMAELIVGDDWERVGPEIIEQRGWGKPCKMVLGKAPRRFGKSMSVGRAAVCAGIVVPGLVQVCTHSLTHNEYSQAIFSTGRRAATNLLDIAYKVT